MKRTDAFIIVDVQGAFLAGGGIPVVGGEDVIPPILQIAPECKIIVATLDEHPPDHKSFTKWPRHAVAGTPEARLHPDIAALEPFIVRKGGDPKAESYSGFRDEFNRSSELTGWLRYNRVKRIFVCGLAFDFCVGETALHGIDEGFETFVLRDATRSVDINGSHDTMVRRLIAKGVRLINSSDLRQ